MSVLPTLSARPRKAKLSEDQHRERQIGQLKWKAAAKLGFRVVEVAA
jgi:hypothetical protein